MRVSIIGLPGSGKSTLARRISKEFGVPHIHLDRFWFTAGGHRLKAHDEVEKDRVREYVRNSMERAIAQDSWVSDGFYSRVQPMIADRANVLLYLDIPFWKRCANHFVRVFDRKNRHPEIPFWEDLLFFREMIPRTIKTKPKITALIRNYKDKLVVLHSQKEIEKYFETLRLDK